MKSESKKYKSFTFGVDFKDATCIISVREEGKSIIYQGKYNNDTIPGEYNVLVDPQNLYDVINSNPEAVEIEDPLRFDIFWPTGKTKKKLCFPLHEKEQSHEEKVLREFSELKQKLGFTTEELLHTKAQLNVAKTQIHMMEEEIQLLRNQLLEEKANSSFLERDKSILRDMEAQLDQYRREILNRDETIKLLMGEAARQQPASRRPQLSPSFTQSSRSAPTSEEIEYMKLIQESLIFENQIEEKQLYGNHLFFKPLVSSINTKYYDNNGQMLTKNKEGSNGIGKFLPCSDPLPKYGKSFYKFLCKFAVESPSFKIGLLWNKDVAKMDIDDVNSAVQTSIYYDCSKLYTAKIKNKGAETLALFQVQVGKSIIMVVDWNKKEIRWHLQAELKVTVPMPPEMLLLQMKICCFLQMENNGDIIMPL